MMITQRTISKYSCLVLPTLKIKYLSRLINYNVISLLVNKYCLSLLNIVNFYLHNLKHIPLIYAKLYKIQLIFRIYNKSLFTNF